MKKVFPSLDNFKYQDKWWVIDIGGNNLRLIAFIEFKDNRMYVKHIGNKNDYAQALALMDELIEDYENQKLLIDVLSVSIARWEDTSPEFKLFNDRVEKLNSGVATLKVIMEQQGLGVADLPEIGSKSL